MSRIRMGDLGDDQREYEFEPFTTPAIPEPAPTPISVPEPQREPVPA